MKTDAVDPTNTLVPPNPTHNMLNSIIKQISNFGQFRDKNLSFILIDYYALCLLKSTSSISTRRVRKIKIQRS